MYKLTNDPHVIQRIEDGAFVPADGRNVDFQAYLEWTAIEGNAPEAPDEVPEPEEPSLEQVASQLQDLQATMDVLQERSSANKQSKEE